jgi:hypothetical protein
MDRRRLLSVAWLLATTVLPPHHGGIILFSNAFSVESPRPRRKRPLPPPPKDENEIRLREKEVFETIRMLDGLKLGSQQQQQRLSSPAKATAPSSSSSTSAYQLSIQQKQEKELMEQLKLSLKRTQQKSITTSKSSNVTDANSNASPQSAINTTVTQSSSSSSLTPSGQTLGYVQLLQQYIEQFRPRPANELKVELSSLGLSDKGRKPDMVSRLAKHYAIRDTGYQKMNHNTHVDDVDADIDLAQLNIPSFINKPSSVKKLDYRHMSFAGIHRLSNSAANALHQAFGNKDREVDDEGEDDDESYDTKKITSLPEPTPIQKVAIPYLFYPPNPSALLHAPTGSGKTIAYLLPITETLWKEIDDGGGDDDMSNGMALILLPTRELAAQVAGVATVLAPPGMVRLIPRPMDLMSTWNYEIDRGEEYEYLEKMGLDDDNAGSNGGGKKYSPRILIGSAKAISTSLFGDTKMPGTPTNKPEGKQLLSSIRWLVLDEVDRLLDIEKSRSDKKSRRHEKPAALLVAAIVRLTVGRAQVIAASATIGRPLRRELSRVLGLHSSECPETLRGEDDTTKLEMKMVDDDNKHIGRAVKIPDAVRNYVLPVDGSTTGSLLTAAAFASKSILRPPPGSEVSSRKVLLVLTRKCDIKVHNALGALRHFGISPEPQSLLDALEADGTDRLVEAHRRVSRVEGVGGAKDRKDGTKKQTGMKGDNDEGYLLVTHEDNVRGLHLDGLDAVIVVGRPGSPDEYTHIAGRVGRAGRRGSVLNIVSFEQAAALASWTMMLGVDFLPVEESGLSALVDE